jgi:hypothetical protein
LSGLLNVLRCAAEMAASSRMTVNIMDLEDASVDDFEAIPRTFFPHFPRYVAEDTSDEDAL